jgi:hypothetical protein
MIRRITGVNVQRPPVEHLVESRIRKISTLYIEAMQENVELKEQLKELKTICLIKELRLLAHSDEPDKIHKIQEEMYNFLLSEGNLDLANVWKETLSFCSAEWERTVYNGIGLNYSKNDPMNDQVLDLKFILRRILVLLPYLYKSADPNILEKLLKNFNS